MRVVYKKSIVEQIALARRDASLIAREIEHVEISKAEARQLLTEINYPYFLSATVNFEAWLNGYDETCRLREPQPPLEVNGIDVKVV